MEAAADGSTAVAKAENPYEVPVELPVQRYAKEIAQSVRDNPVTVVIGDTGSGKTTQISQILLDAGLVGSKAIGVTQPRRVAAVSVARRVAQERKCSVGREVGYTVRFDDCSSPATKIKYLTDGCLLREVLEDSQLSRYSIIVLDEAHERSLSTDILFGLLKGLVRSRLDPLKLVVTSATLDGDKFSSYFFDCPIFNVPGRMYPVTLAHALEPPEPPPNHLEGAVDTVMDIHVNRPLPGDILLFLTGQEEIDRVVRQLNARVAALPSADCADLQVLPLYASLPPEMQARIFSAPPEGCRRCVVSTNLAETSLTVPGIVYVVDPGLVKQKEYDPASGMESLVVRPISVVQAVQRAGRAGRTQPGFCFRLYTKEYLEKDMPAITQPEIQRTSLVGAVLHLKSLALKIDVLSFDFLDPPETESLCDALRQLFALDAIDADGAITPLGRRMAALPLDPPLARAILAADELGCFPEMCAVAGMLSAERVFLSGPNDPDALPPTSIVPAKEAALGDFVVYLRLFQAWERAGRDRDFCKDHRLNPRAMDFAAEVRKQLSGTFSQRSGDRGGGDRSDRGGAGGGGGGGGGNGEGGGGSGRPEDRSGRDGGRGSAHGHGQQGKGGSAGSITDLRKALCLGFANKIARRLPRHNGYRTFNDQSVLAQVHPGSGRGVGDEEGLGPEWIVYKELVTTSRPYLRDVCAVEGSWVEPLAGKLIGVDVEKLSGGRMRKAGVSEADAAGAAEAARRRAEAQRKREEESAANKKKADDAVVQAARDRYLKRKAAGGPAPAAKR